MKKTTGRAAILTVVLLITASCGRGVGEGTAASEEVTTEETAPSETAEESTTEAEPVADETEVAPEPTEQVEAEFISDAPVLVDESGQLDLGSTWRIDTLDTPLTFSVPEDLVVIDNDNGLLIVTSSRSTGQGDRGIQFLRPARIADPADPEYNLNPTQGWDPRDIEGWIDAMPIGLAMENRTETSIGGFPAVQFDVTLTNDAPECRPDHRCASFGDNGPWSGIEIISNVHYRFWAIDLGDSDPVLIAAANRGPEEDWFNTVDQLLSTLAFGDIAPNAISLEDPGTFEFDVHDGIRLTSTRPFLLNSDWSGSVALTDLSWWLRDVEFLTRPNGLDGNPIGNSDNLVTYLEENNFAVTELDGTVLDGFETRVFQVGSGPFLDAFSRTEDTGISFAPSPRSLWWVIDHPDRGLLINTAEHWDPQGEPELFDEVATWGEELFATLEFIE